MTTDTQKTEPRSTTGLEKLPPEIKVGIDIEDAHIWAVLSRSPKPPAIRIRGVGKHNFNNHSPTGQEWGYGGSGSAALAADLLIDCGARPTVAEVGGNYQDLKWDLLSVLPSVGPHVIIHEATEIGVRFVAEPHHVAREIVFNENCPNDAILISLLAVREWLASRLRGDTGNVLIDAVAAMPESSPPASPQTPRADQGGEGWKRPE